MSNKCNDGYFEKNMAYFSKYYAGSSKKLQEEEFEDNNEFEIVPEESYTNQTILSVINSYGDKKYLSGKYAPGQAMLHWLEKQGKIEFATTVFVLGMGDVWGINNLIGELGEQVSYVIYEPSIKLFLNVLKEYDISEIVEKPNVSVLIEGINTDYVNDVLVKKLSFDNMLLTKIYVSGNYSELFPNEIHNMITAIKKRIDNIRVTWNTTLRFTNVVGNNVLNNIAFFYHGYSMNQFEKIMPSNVPAIIVSAGPSLNKNIDDLRDAVGKACIIATDTALKPLLNHNIKPDFVAIVDGKKPADLLRHESAKDVALLTSTIVSKNAMNYHHGKKIFYGASNPFEEGALEHINRRKKTYKLSIPMLPTGGSVATSAYSFALYMGTKNIILVGQDLAMTGNKTHADGTFKEKMDTINVESPEYFPIEGIDGEMVYTRNDFKMYLDWFEESIKHLDDIKVIDATEGGALIHGTEIETLKDAIKRYCIEDWEFSKVMDNTPEMLSEYDKSQLLAYFQDSVTQLYRVKKKAQEGIHHYEKMLSMCNKKELNSQKYLEITKKIKKINSFMNSDTMALYVSSNLQGIEYSMRASIYMTEEDEKDERISIAKQGLFILRSIMSATQEIITNVEKKLLPYNGDDELLYSRYSEADSKLII